MLRFFPLLLKLKKNLIFRGLNGDLSFLHYLFFCFFNLFFVFLFLCFVRGDLSPRATVRRAAGGVRGGAAVAERLRPSPRHAR